MIVSGSLAFLLFIASLSGVLAEWVSFFHPLTEGSSNVLEINHSPFSRCHCGDSKPADLKIYRIENETDGSELRILLARTTPGFGPSEMRVALALCWNSSSLSCALFDVVAEVDMDSIPIPMIAIAGTFS